MAQNPMNEIIVAARTHPSRPLLLLLLAGVIATLASAAVLAGAPSHDTGGGIWSKRVAPLIRGIRSDATSFADVVDAVKPAVIGVQSKRPASAEALTRLRRPSAGRAVTSMGSAFFISADGYAVTNNHVIEGSATVTVETDDEKTYTAKGVATD